MRKLALDDIADARAYEREREQVLRQIIDIKRVRRVPVGRFVTLVFENRDTVRFQIQEMARAERMLTDAAIQTELDIYNRLIPDRGELSATLFVELTTREELEQWLPQLVGVERAVGLRIGAGPDVTVVRASPEEEHATQLTREDLTSAVHYLRLPLGSVRPETLTTEPMTLFVDHPSYQAETALSDATKAALRSDLCA